MKYRHMKKWILLAGIVLSAVASHFSGAINSYYLQIVIFIGINITLAVSLNLINGYTGQFSLGHAGFMAIGAYVSAYLSTEHSTAFFKAFGTNFFSIALLFIGVLITGGLAASVPRLIVRVPSLRLKWHYLAIFTLASSQFFPLSLRTPSPARPPPSP